MVTTLALVTLKSRSCLRGYCEWEVVSTILNDPLMISRMIFNLRKGHGPAFDGLQSLEERCRCEKFLFIVMMRTRSKTTKEKKSNQLDTYSSYSCPSMVYLYLQDTVTYMSLWPCVVVPAVLVPVQHTNQ